MSLDLDTIVRLAIYPTIAETAAAPTAVAVAQRIGAAPQQVEAAFTRLYEKRLLVPEPGHPSRIRMAPPFSGVPTAFPVEARGKRYYANCVWDALGIPDALHEDAVIPAADAFTGERVTRGGKRGRAAPRGGRDGIGLRGRRPGRTLLGSQGR